MKFTCETIRTLYSYNDDGTQVALQEGAEVYLKLDLQHMDLWNKEKWMREYPGGWVRGVLYKITPSGRSITFEIGPCSYFSLTQKNILAVSDKIPEEATK